MAGELRKFARNLASDLASGLCGLAAGGGSAYATALALGLGGTNTAFTISIIDEAMIACFVGLGAGAWGGQIAALQAPPLKAAWLGALAGSMVGLGTALASKAGISEGLPVAIVGIMLAQLAGRAVRKLLNPPDSTS